MSEDKHNSEEAEVKYEGWEITLKPIVYFLFYLALATALVAALMYGMFQFLENKASAEDEAARKEAPIAGERQVIPPKPILQLAPSEPGQTNPGILTNHPLIELKTLKEEEARKLENYGWVDESTGVVRLPIDRAKQLLLERGGLLSRPEGEQKSTASQPDAKQTDQMKQDEPAKDAASSKAKATGSGQ